MLNPASIPDVLLALSLTAPAARSPASRLRGRYSQPRNDVTMALSSQLLLSCDDTLSAVSTLLSICPCRYRPEPTGNPCTQDICHSIHEGMLWKAGNSFGRHAGAYTASQDRQEAGYMCSKRVFLFLLPAEW